MGCASIHLKGNRANEYMKLALRGSNRGWQSNWFYLKSQAVGPLSPYIGRTPSYSISPRHWSDGPTGPPRRRLDHILNALRTLKEIGLSGAGVIGAYHARRLAPLMAREYLMYQMVPAISLDDTAKAGERLKDSEIQQRIREALDTWDGQYPIAGHPAMLPEPSAMVFVSELIFAQYFFYFLCSSPC